jgi:hypothetical protein
MINFLIGFVSSFVLMELIRIIVYRLNKKALEFHLNIDDVDKELNEYKKWQETKDT